MKKLIFIPIFLSLLNQILAQPYKSCFGEKSTKWFIAKPTNDGYITGSGGVDERKIVDKMFYYSTSGDGYLKEDTISGRIWYYDNKEMLIMDLSLNIGDTLNVNSKIINYSKNINIIITKIYQDEQNRKVLESDLILNFDQGQTFKFKFIEGVGPNSGFYYFFEDYKRQNQLLLCYYKDDQFVYSNTELNGICNYETLVYVPYLKNIENIRLSYSNNCLYLNFSKEFRGNIMLYNVLGKLISEDNSDSVTEYKINLSRLAKGIYFIHLTDNYSNSHTLKFIK